MIPVILSGGSGSRLWPKSRRAYPKQFLRLASSDATMIQQTVLRLQGLNTHAPVVVSNREHRFLVAEQLREIDTFPDGILLEPCSRNTAPAVALAALYALKSHDDPILLVLPADHVIKDISAFHKAVSLGKQAAEHNFLVTFGIVPSRVETGYGYIHRGKSLASLQDTYQINKFIEKPKFALAQEFIADNSYYWNSGMFIFKASLFLEELENFSPEILSHAVCALENAEKDRDFTWINHDAFSSCPENSIDYAVMEKTLFSATVPLDAGWSDIGSWQSLWEVNDRDISGNVTQGEVIAIDSSNCLFVGDKRLIAAVGVDNLVIVDSDDAVLVTTKNRSQDVKKVVSALKNQGGDKHLFHRKVFRPWGHYDSIDSGDRFQVKRITVKPGERLSLQMHHHRAEHWVVVRGTAKVTCGEKTLLLTENESTFIPLGVTHRLENPGKVELEIIEVQSGSYLGEDDILRFDDVYGRDK